MRHFQSDAAAAEQCSSRLPQAPLHVQRSCTLHVRVRVNTTNHCIVRGGPLCPKLRLPTRPFCGAARSYMLLHVNSHATASVGVGVGVGISIGIGRSMGLRLARYGSAEVGGGGPTHSHSSDERRTGVCAPPPLPTGVLLLTKVACATAGSTQRLVICLQ